MRRRALLPVALAVLAAGAPPAASAFAKLEVGERLEAPPLPALAGGSAPLVSPEARANVVLFFRPRQATSLETLRELAACQRELGDRPVRWAGVVSGRWGREEVRALVDGAGLRMTVLVDEGDRLYGRLGVRLHPTIGVAAGDGTLLAYEPFRKIHWRDVVCARILHALGELDDAGLRRVLDPPPAARPRDVKRGPPKRGPVKP